MAIDKAIEYKMQGSKKPAKNYLGKQKTVSKVPVKWQSGPDTPPTELAYITEAEKDLILKADLHGSLKDGPNTGPDGIMSLDSQGDYTRDRSPGAYSSGPAGSGGGNTQQDLRNRAMNEKHMREILTGQKNIGQTTQTGPRTRQYSNLPEYMKVKQKDGTYKDKYIGSAYKSYGTPSFFGNLFSRGAPGYRGIKGLSAFGTPTFEATQGPDGMGYYTDDTDFGDTRDPVPLGIMGLIANAINKFKKPKDMSEFNDLGLLTDRVNPTFQNDLGNELMLSTQKTPERPTQTFSFDNSGMTKETDDYTDADFTNEYGYPMTAGLLDNIGVRPTIGMENTGLGFSIPTGDVGLNASGRLGNLSATVDAIEALKGESVNPELNYSGQFGNTNVYGNYSDDVQNLGLNFNNDKGLSGGISYDAITGEPRFDIGFRRTFADGGLASMFTRRG
jgi:hypothetical protein